MIRKKKLYARPTKPFEKSRIEEENVLAERYGLKNKREIWKSLAKVNYFRKRAMDITKAPREEQDIFFSKLSNIGLKASSTSDVLDLQVEDLLKRRLSTIVLKLKLANTVKQARQMIVHKKIIVNGRIINSPSYIVQLNEESKIEAKKNISKDNPTKETEMAKELNNLNKEILIEGA